MLIPLILPPQVRLWDVYVTARACGFRLVFRDFRLYLDREMRS